MTTLDSLDNQLYLTPGTQGSKAQVSSQLAERCMCVISHPVTFPQPREEGLWSSRLSPVEVPRGMTGGGVPSVGGPSDSGRGAGLTLPSGVF